TSAISCSFSLIDLKVPFVSSSISRFGYWGCTLIRWTRYFAGSQYLEVREDIVGIVHPALVISAQLSVFDDLIVAKHRLGFHFRLDQHLPDCAPTAFIDLRQDTRQLLKGELGNVVNDLEHGNYCGNRFRPVKPFEWVRRFSGGRNCHWLLFHGAGKGP